MKMQRTIGMLMLLLWSIVAVSQNVSISGDIVDAFLDVAIEDVTVSLHRSDSTLIADSLPTATFRTRDGKLMAYEYNITFTPIAGQSTYLIHTYKKGYGDGWTPFTLSANESLVNIPTIKMRREQQVQLDEVVVKATQIKMFYRGDTLIYNADAFKLPDGSMLGNLIAQLPGVTMNDGGEIFVNGRKVDELLLGSRSFLHGNRKVLMENLPYYIVNHLKVYEKTSDLSLALGHEVDQKKYVMDVNLKPEYQVGYLANVEAAAGTENRWLGRGFFLGFTHHWRYTVRANSNNVDERGNIGQTDYWSPDRMPRSITITQSLTGEIDYELQNSTVKKLTNTLMAEYEHLKTTADMSQRSETFLEGVTPVSLNETSSRNHSYKVTLNENFSVLSPYYISLEGNFSREKTRGRVLSDFHQWNDTLAASTFSSTMDESTITSGFVTTDVQKCINAKKQQDVGLNMLFMYYNNAVERARQYDTWQYANASVTNNTNEIMDKTLQGTVGASFRQPLNEQWRIDANVGYTRRDTRKHDFLFHPDTITLPSQLDFLTAITDAKNSYTYRYTTHKESLKLNLANIKSKQMQSFLNVTSVRFSFTLEIPISQQRLAYQRGTLDTIAHKNALYLNPTVNFKHTFGQQNRNEIRASASFTTYEQDLLKNISYKDDSQPLVVLLGSPGLKTRQVSRFLIDYANHNCPHKQEISVGTHLDFSHRDVAQSVAYNVRTGVYTYQPVNVSGDYLWETTLNYSRDLDEQHLWSVQSNTSATWHHSVDYTMLTGAVQSELNKVNTLFLDEKAYVQYHKNVFHLRLSGDVKWRHSEGRMSDFSTLNIVDYQYGISGYYTLPLLKTTLAVDANIYSRRGYGSSSLNTDDIVLNASLSQSLMKGKLIARIEGFDLLHQLSGTSYEVNAQGRTETVYRSLPHYVMLHLVYHWSKNPKRK
jgi:hypothetical protein